MAGPVSKKFLECLWKAMGERSWLFNWWGSFVGLPAGTGEPCVLVTRACKDWRNNMYIIGSMISQARIGFLLGLQALYYFVIYII